MSLLDNFTEPFTLLNMVRTSDGQGGFTTSWEDGAEINIAVRYDSSMEARRAEKEGMTSVYTFLVSRSIELNYHDVLRRKSDQQIFRITSRTGDSVTPSSSSLSLTAVTAERWELPA